MPRHRRRRVVVRCHASRRLRHRPRRIVPKPLRRRRNIPRPGHRWDGRSRRVGKRLRRRGLRQARRNIPPGPGTRHRPAHIERPRLASPVEPEHHTRRLTGPGTQPSPVRGWIPVARVGKRLRDNISRTAPMRTREAGRKPAPSTGLITGRPARRRTPVANLGRPQQVGQIRMPVPETDMGVGMGKPRRVNTPRRSMRTVMRRRPRSPSVDRVPRRPARPISGPIRRPRVFMIARPRRWRSSSPVPMSRFRKRLG